ncbi:hypothetical protein PG997_000427 [Apiospora hydei]|uniref:Uncharacterized protein n=1 Tax=Apiospora hydei TaxID=1337664 RepID=A0ABR1XAV7_9PEZI
MSKTDDRQAEPAPAAQSLQRMVFEHWGNGWYTPSIPQSQSCIVLSAVVAALLALVNHYTTTGDMSLMDVVIYHLTCGYQSVHFVAGVLLKLLCVGVESALLATRQELRRRYPPYFYTNHTPVDSGVVFVCTMLTIRTLVFQCEPDFSLLV